MIVLLVSAGEVEALIEGKADNALKHYLARECRMERLLPDSNLPIEITLKQLDFTEDGRAYTAIIRTYATSEQADQAWAQDFSLTAEAV